MSARRRIENKNSSTCIRLLFFSFLLVFFCFIPLQVRFFTAVHHWSSIGTSSVSQPQPAAVDTTSKTQNDVSLVKLRRQFSHPDEETKFNRTNKIYVDFGLSDGKDTELFLSKGYSVVSVDAYPSWVQKAKEKFQKEIRDENRLWLFNVGLALDDAEAMPLYFKQEGSVIASFVENKGCQGLRPGHPNCKHHDVEVVRCEAILQLINAQVEIMKVDIEMLHHTCLRSLHRLESRILPKYLCWEEHDKPFGSARTLRPITDTKLILGLYELGYDGVKIVMQGPKAANYYGLKKEQAGFGQGSGTLTPDEMMHYRSHEGKEDGEFDSEWRNVNKVLQDGIFGNGIDKPEHFFGRSTYFDICMKLSNDADTVRSVRALPENFPLASYANNSKNKS